MDDLLRAKKIVARMLDFDFPGAGAYRDQFVVARFSRHATGCAVEVDRCRVAPASFDARFPAARLGTEAAGHGKLLVWIHGFEGYLDDVELLNATRFPDPTTVRIRSL